MELTKNQIDELYKFTRKHYVYHYDVQSELVDHLANDIENIWQETPNLSFEQARYKSFKKFGIFGFMDVVENFCFNESKNPPEDKVLDALLDFVTTKSIDEEDKLKTKELSPFSEHGVDTTPVIRSFILQYCKIMNQNVFQKFNK